MQATVVQTCPGAAQGPVEKTRPGIEQDSVVQIKTFKVWCHLRDFKPKFTENLTSYSTAMLNDVTFYHIYKMISTVM
jgi:hypothetical protein